MSATTNFVWCTCLIFIIGFFTGASSNVHYSTVPFGEDPPPLDYVKKDQNLNHAGPTSKSTTTTVKHVGRDKTPVVILDNVLPERAYISLRDDLRRRTDFVEGDGNNKIATLDWAIVEPLLDAVLGNKPLTDIYPRAIFEQREHVRGVATILCNPGWVHNDHMGSGHQDTVAPAAVFYFGYDGVANAPAGSTKKTGTAFYREKETGLERLTKLGGDVTEFCAKYPRSLGCSHRGKEVEHKIEEKGDTGKNEGGSHTTSVLQDFSAFEETYRVVGEPNRLVVYPQDVLRYAWVENALETEATATTFADLPCSPKDGRLAISLFFLKQGGQKIVDVLDGVWRTEATERLRGVGQVVARKLLVPRRRLDITSHHDCKNAGGSGYAYCSETGVYYCCKACSLTAKCASNSGLKYCACNVPEQSCDAWVKGEMFNVVNGDCALSATTTVGDGETLRIRGKDGLDHPVLDRGGKSNGETTVTDRHFVMTGTSHLTLVNLKLMWAWVGNVDSGCMKCGYCKKTKYGPVLCCGCIDPGPGHCDVCGCPTECDDNDKGGALRIGSSTSTVVLVDVIFASNTAYSSTGNIFSTTSSAKLYYMNNGAPSNIGGITPIPLKKCDAETTLICNSTSGIPYSEYYHKDDALCIMDGTPSVARCGCPLGYYASRMFYGPCMACPNGYSSINSGAETKDKCTSCESGQFQSIVSGVLSCKICPAGYYQITSGQPTCTACQTGQYLTQDNSKASDHTLKAQCLPCQPGRSFSNITTECPVCSSGRYQTEETNDGRKCRSNVLLTRLLSYHSKLTVFLFS